MKASNILGFVFCSIFASGLIVGPYLAPEDPRDLCNERFQDVEGCIKILTPEVYSKIKTDSMVYGVLGIIIIFLIFFFYDRFTANKKTIFNSKQPVNNGSENQ